MTADLTPKVSLYFHRQTLYFSIMSRLRNFLADEQGQDLIEYTLLVGFITLASASIFVSVGGISGIWGDASSQLAAANASHG
jgi:Flp pilus assembly pilin Flp